VIHSNLGGLGPDSIVQKNIRYGGVAKVGSTEIDLVVTALDEYQSSKAEKNGHADNGNEIVRIFQRSGTSMTLEFAFVDAKTSSPVTLHNFAFSFLDIDGFAGTKVRETISVCGSTRRCAGDHLEEIDAELNGCHKFRPKTLDSHPNPKDMNSLTSIQKGHTLTVEFEAASSFVVTSSITSGKNHRPFLFTGSRVGCEAAACQLG
jgi:hypothetical protein